MTGKEKTLEDILVDCAMLLRGEMDYKGPMDGAQVFITNWKDYHIIRVKNGDTYRLNGRHISLVEVVAEG